ncbi:MAG: double zinc ribbon domain-containing protein, partial [Pacificimonas sp.]
MNAATLFSRTRDAVQRAGANALDLVLPPRCPGCREVTPTPDRFCGDCWQDLTFITAPMCETCGLPFGRDTGPDTQCGECQRVKRPYTSARAALAYDGPAVPVVLGFKHGGRVHLAKMMAAQMARLVPQGTPPLF